MIEAIANYTIRQKISENNNSLVYQAFRQEDQLPVILKLPQGDYPSQKQILHYHREYQLIGQLHLEGVIQSYELQDYQHKPLLVLEDFGGKSLKYWLKSREFTLLEILEIAIKITDAIAQIHHQDIVHKDINSSNLVYNPDTNQLKIIDFGIATLLSRQNPSLASPEVLEGTLTHISPEQTGRMNRPLDYRTDFYAFGITLYQLLTKQLPFTAQEPLQLIYSHLAKKPSPLIDINPDIPPSLNNLVLKLIAKNVEARYQSTEGIKADLERCLTELKQGEMTDFPLATCDRTDDLPISQQLYNRANVESQNLVGARSPNISSEISSPFKAATSFLKDRQDDKENDFLNITINTSSSVAQILDMGAVMKAAKAISGELELDKLLATFMSILLESAGAQAGYLLLESQGQWLIEARGTGEEITVLESLPVANHLPQAIVNHVIQTGSSVVENNAQAKFIHDPYLQKHQTKSLLCAPLLHQGKILGIIYLENNLATGIFDAQRLAMLKVLSSQAIMSITNAKLYQELQQRENQLRQFLDAIPLGVSVHNLQGEISYINPVGQILIQQGQETLLGDIDEDIDWDIDWAIDGDVSESINENTNGAVDIDEDIDWDIDGDVDINEDIVREISKYLNAGDRQNNQNIQNIKEKPKLDNSPQFYQADTSKLYPREDLPLVRALRGESAVVDDIEIHHPDRTIPLEVHSTPIFNAQGQVIYVVNTLMDISQRKQAAQILLDYNYNLEAQVAERTKELEEEIVQHQRTEFALQQSEAQNLAMLQAIPDLMFRMTGAGVYLSYAGASEVKDLVHLSSSTSNVGKHLAETVPLDICQRHMHYINQALTTGEIQMYVQSNKFGEPVQYEEVRVVPIEGKEEVLFMIRDVSDRKQAENNLKQKNQELADTLNQLQQMQHELIHSEKMAALGQLVAGVAHEINNPLGAISSSVENISDFFNKTLGDLPTFFQSLSAEEKQAFSYLLRTSAAQTVSLSSKEKRQIRRGLSEELETLEIENSDTIADTLVDIGVYSQIDPLLPILRSPTCNHIIKFAYQLATLKTSSDTIRMASSRAAKIVFALKSYARYDQSGNKSAANLIDGIETVLTIYQNQLKQGVEIHRIYPEEVPLILCYPDELNQVWTNLVHNALQAMNNKGTLTITVQLQKKHMCLEITDSGKGIPPEILPKIFDPFFTTKPIGEGSGLGLNIVKKIIDKHDGTISVRSVPKATTFSIYLPLLLANESSLITDL